MIALVWDDTAKVFDFADDDGLLREDNGFLSAIFESLFSDARDPDDAVPNVDRRGYWGDVFTPGQMTGSLIYKLRARPFNSESLVFARAWAQSSLEWLLQAGAAASVSAETEPLTRDSFLLKVVVISTDDQRFASAWKVTRDGGVMIYGL